MTRKTFAALAIITLGLLLPGLAGCQPTDNETVSHSRDVTATAYTLRPAETRPDGEPGLGAWGHELKPGHRVIAVSPDLLKLGLAPGTEVTIDGVDGVWVVRDKMHSRWTDRIDLFMGEDVEAALAWGRRKVTIHWTTSATD